MTDSGVRQMNQPSRFSSDEFEILQVVWEDGERICRAGDTILLPAGTLHQSEALEEGAIYAIATRPATSTGA